MKLTMQYLAAPTMESNILDIFSRARLATVAPEALQQGKDPSDNPQPKSKQPVYCLSFYIKQYEKNKTQRWGGIARRFGGNSDT